MVWQALHRIVNVLDAVQGSAMDLLIGQLREFYGDLLEYRENSETQLELIISNNKVCTVTISRDGKHIDAHISYILLYTDFSRESHDMSFDGVDAFFTRFTTMWTRHEVTMYQELLDDALKKLNELDTSLRARYGDRLDYQRYARKLKLILAEYKICTIRLNDDGTLHMKIILLPLEMQERGAIRYITFPLNTPVDDVLKYITDTWTDELIDEYEETAKSEKGDLSGNDTDEERQ